MSLKNDNKALRDSISQLKSAKNQISQPICCETENSELESKIRSLEKKFGELKSTLTDLNKDHRQLHQQYLKFLENYNDGILCEKTGERLSQRQICAMQQDVLLAQDTVQKLQANFDAFKNKVNDKLNHATQLMKAATVPSPMINPHTPASVCSKPTNEQISLVKTATPNEIGNRTGETGSSQHSYASSVVKPRDASRGDDTIKTSAAVIENIDLRQKNLLIIGDSMLKRIKTARFDNSGKSFIQTIRGGKIEDISSYIDKIPDCNPKSVVLHVGTNNLTSDSPDTMVEKFENMIQKTNKKFPSAKLFVSEIISREKSYGLERDDFDIASMNRTLQNLAKKYGAQIINHDNLRDASYRYDGLHLTYKGTSILVNNIKTTCWPSNLRQTTHKVSEHTRVPNIQRKQQLQQSQQKQLPKQSNKQQQIKTADSKETQQTTQTNRMNSTDATNPQPSQTGTLPLQNFHQQNHGFFWPYGNYSFPYFPSFPPFTTGLQWPRTYGQTY